MQTTEWNRRIWNERYKWDDGGNEWSSWWGSPEKQWYGTILPRIAEFLPTGNCLEIAPGYGRWTQFLLPLAEQLTAIDISSRCVDACRQRFAGCSHLSVFVNDGKSLDMVPDGSLDFVFSFDSLVHVEWDVLDAYLKQLKRKLKPNGSGFIHHSNIGSYSRHYWPRKIPLVKSIIKRLRPNLTIYARAFSMTAERFRHLTTEAGLSCVRQELFNWGESFPYLIDCISVFTARQTSAPCKVTHNPQFMTQVRRIREECDSNDLKNEAERLLGRSAA